MVHRPRTFTGYVLLVLVAAGIGWMLVALQGLLANPLLWAFFGIAGLIYLAVILYRRRVDAARERAWVGSFSFAEAVASLHAREAKQIADERRPRAVEPTV